jgi:hypothetical protein
MKWITESEIQEFFSGNNYDIRVSHNGRWIDQKCTADVTTIVSDCISHYVESNGNSPFSSMNIWHDKYTVANIESIFKKPNPDEVKARNEYDKFFQQPMEMLAYSKVLSKQKIGNRNFYQVANKDILDFIGMREKNCLVFLRHYIEKVLKDSGILVYFNNFFSQQTQDSYNSLRNAYLNFTIHNTPINGETESGRIFTKVINPLAYFYNSKGTERGRLSRHKITYDALMYNRDNFRDLYLDKPKGLTRKQFAEQQGITLESTYYIYLSQKAKRYLRMFNDTYRDGRTEAYQENHIKDYATHIHHIFSESSFPEICMYIENLIALTPTQHLNYAHPLGRSSEINKTYQYFLLTSKLGSISENLTKGKEKIYDFGKFLYVLSIGFDDDNALEIEPGRYDHVATYLNTKYS